MSSERCGSIETTTGKPCRFPKVRDECPYHGGGPRVENGRPSLYSREIADHICSEIARGRSLQAICREDDGTPAASTVIDWVTDDRDGFSERYARACHTRLHVWGEQMIEIADDGWNDTYIGERGGVMTDHDVIQRSKLRVDTRKWFLSKLMPEKYGDYQKVEHSGMINVNEVSPRDELEEMLDQLSSRQVAVVTRDGKGNGRPG